MSFPNKVDVALAVDYLLHGVCSQLRELSMSMEVHTYALFHVAFCFT